MSDKKTLLEEGTIRRFMKLANMEAVGTGFINEMYSDGDIEEGKRRGKKKRRLEEEDVDLEEGSHDKDDEDVKEGMGSYMKDDMKDDDPMKEMYHGGKMADDDEMKDDLEEMSHDMKDDAEPMQDDEEMDLDVEDEEEEMDMDAGDMGELTLTDEEAEVFLKVADKVRAAMEMDAPEEMPAPDMGDMDEPMDDMSPDMDAEMDAEEEMEEEPMMEDMVNEVARRVARRLSELKKSK